MEESSPNPQAKNKIEQEHLIFWLTHPLSVFIILANIFIILGILFNRKLHGTTSWFFLSLLFADLLAGAALPFIPELTLHKELSKHLCFFKYVVPNFLFLSFLANLLVMHYAKYACIVRPLHYRQAWVHRWPALYIFLAWTTPLIFASLPLTWYTWGSTVNCSYSVVLPKPYLYIETYGFLIPAILAMAFMCTQMLCVARRQLNNITKLLHSVNQGQAPSELEQRLELRNAKSIASMSLIFLACWVPYMVCLNISLVSIDHSISPPVLTIVTCIGTGSAAAVPIILSCISSQYTLFWRDMASKAWQSCCKGQGCKEDQADPKANLPHGNLCTTDVDLNGVPT
ncbi:G-protein coupled bile acid receptor 1 [Varanus komodoensis]|uniref:G-protein coupled bile acid receptor 1 n=1 Tax=Varanus komodoensis TaxID=61221 RepID=A0A8D2IR99_VARKO|nr:G-protein coupled bile acid receptor 1 [Varanus komodoensis]KAF7241762.1 G-protein coupled bile acid receptor 1 [Varanus komodoensis]